MKAAVLASILILSSEPGVSLQAVAAKSSTYTYQVEAVVNENKLCVQPKEVTSVRVFVQRYKDGKPYGHVPRIGVTVDEPKYGTVSPSSDFTNRMGNTAFTYTPIKEGQEVLAFNAIGYDYGRPVQISTSVHIQVVKCTYRYVISGYYETPEAPGMAYRADTFGVATVQIHDDGTLDGDGNIAVDHTMRFDVNTGAAKVTFTGTRDTAPLKIKGKLNGDRVIFDPPIFSVALQPMTYTATLKKQVITQRIGGGIVDQNYLQLPSLDVDISGGDGPIDLNRPPSTGVTYIGATLKRP